MSCIIIVLGNNSNYYYLVSKSKLVANNLTNHSLTLQALSPDENEISLYMITTCLNNQVTRIKEVITKDKMS